MLKRTAVERVVAERVMAGEPITVELVLVNRKRLMNCWLMSAHDTIQNDDERLDPSVLFARVPGGGPAVGTLPCALMRRGRYRFGPAQLTARFPLGIVERGLCFGCRARSWSIPDSAGSRHAGWRTFSGDRPGRAARAAARGFDDEFHRIREFRWGDNPRAIHWRTSAGTTPSWSRIPPESRPEPDGPGRPVATASPTTLERERLELAASVAATMCVAT